MNQLMIGSPVPDFSLPALDGKEFTLSAQRGKKVLLYAWASW